MRAYATQLRNALYSYPQHFAQEEPEPISFRLASTTPPMAAPSTPHYQEPIPFPSIIKAELGEQNMLRHTNRAGNEIYTFRASEAPNTMLELGRLVKKPSATMVVARASQPI